MWRGRLERIARRSVAIVQRRAVWLGVFLAFFGRIIDNYSFARGHGYKVRSYVN